MSTEVNLEYLVAEQKPDAEPCPCLGPGFQQPSLYWAHGGGHSRLAHVTSGAHSGSKALAQDSDRTQGIEVILIGKSASENTSQVREKIACSLVQRKHGSQQGLGDLEYGPK